MSNHPSMYWQLSHLSTPFYTFHITIAPLHKCLIHFTPPWWLSHSLTTVTPPQADIHLLHDHHNFPSSDTPVFIFHTSLRTVTVYDNCHTFPHPLTSSPWPSYLHQLKLISNNFHTSLTTVTPPDNCLTFPHSLTPPPWSWSSHLSINWHSCWIPFTPP